MCKSICSSIICYILYGSRGESVHGENSLPIYHPMCLITISAEVILAIRPQEHTFKSQHETILANLNRHMPKTLCLV